VETARGYQVVSGDLKESKAMRWDETYLVRLLVLPFSQQL